MSRDYAKNRANTRKRSGNASRKSSAGVGTKFFPGMVVGLVLGVVLGLVIDLPGLFEEAKTATQQPVRKTPSEPSKPRFDFYTLLRESEVIVSENETPILNERLEMEAQANVQPADSENIYLLQVGSFKSPADADSLRVSLLLLNLDAHIEKVSPKPGETWHRVLVGPLDSRSDVANAREKLASNRIDSLLLKRNR